MRIDLAKYRMNRAKEMLQESKDSLGQNHFALSANRSYYAIFTSARALLALKNMDSRKHSGVIALFNQHIIKKELFPKELSKFLPKAKDIREDADYGDFVKITEDDAKLQFTRATKFIEEAKKTMLKIITTEKT